MPLTPESTWLTALHKLTHWAPPARKTVLISPHPDDETLGAGGLIAAQRRIGLPVTVVAVTDGEAAYPDYPNLAALRISEQERAVRELGVEPHALIRLHFPDSRVTAHETELTNRLRPLIEAETLLIAPWRFDPHPDHEACGRAAETVAYESGATLISYFFWTWHNSSVEDISSLPLVQFPLDPETSARRAAALSQHKSQLFHPTGSPILPESLLLPARRPFETYLVHRSQKADHKN